MFCSCPRLGDRMLSMFCLTASYSRIRFFRLPYSAYSQSFSSVSLEYSSRSLTRSGSLSPTPAAFSARADASKRIISRSRPRRYFSLSRVFLYSEQWMQIFHLELERYKEAKGDVFLLGTEEADAVIREAGTTFLNAIGPRDYKPDYPHKRGKSTMIEDGRLYE